MIYNLDKTPRLNNLRIYILTHNRFITHLVIIFSETYEGSDL